MKLNEEIYRIKSIMGVDLIKEDKGWVCSGESKKEFDDWTNKMTEYFNKAVKWWESWLSNPETKQKFIKNNPNETNVDEIFNQYFNILKQVVPVPYGWCLGWTPVREYGDWIWECMAFVNPKEKNKVYYNMQYFRQEFFFNGSIINPEQLYFEIFVHELQHILYRYKPLNPDEKVSSVFKTKDIGTFFKKIKNFFKSEKQEESSVIKNISKSLSITLEDSKKFYDNLNYYISHTLKKDDEEYLKSHNEQMSRISSIRSRLNINPNDQIEISDLMPFIKKIISKERMTDDDLDILRFLVYWALNGYENLNTVLNKLNSLAYQEKNKNTTSDMV